MLERTEGRVMTTRRNASIAAIVGGGGRSVQSLFAAVAGDLRAEGLCVIGVISEAHGLPDRTCSAGFLRDIATGAQFSIYLQDPPRDTSCHLDESGLDAACGRLLQQIPGCDLIIISKFGKSEAGGRGLTPAFEAAIKAHKPILTSVSEQHLAAWRAFAPDAMDLPCDELAVRRWGETVSPATVSGAEPGAPQRPVAL
jgi:nucleoside-triphosphatase THEP1